MTVRSQWFLPNGQPKLGWTEDSRTTDSSCKNLFRVVRVSPLLALFTPKCPESVILESWQPWLCLTEYSILN